MSNQESRRAQPEGEAPQAEAVTCKGCNGNGMVGNILDTDVCPFCQGSGQESAPAPGAQHAESGKEVGNSVADFNAWMAKRGSLGAGGHPSRAFIAGHTYGARAAQQAAAPGALPDQAQFEAQAKYQGATDFTLVHPDFARCNNGWEPATYRDPMTELAWRVWANKRVASSAPGTPEAPAAAEKLYSSWLHSQPDRYNIPPWRLLAESVKIEWEQRAAAQLDGGQEGSD